jgi:hypothetical protein
MSMLTDVHSYLAANGQSANLYIGSLPDSPDVVVGLFQYQGRPPAEVLEVLGIRRERPGLQVQVRSAPNGYADAEARAYQIYDLLQVANATLGSGFYQEVRPFGSPFPLGRDASRRVVIAANYLVSRDWT